MEGGNENTVLEGCDDWKSSWTQRQDRGRTRWAPKLLSLPPNLLLQCLILTLRTFFPEPLQVERKETACLEKGADSPAFQLAMRTWQNEGFYSHQVPSSPSPPSLGFLKLGSHITKHWPLSFLTVWSPCHSMSSKCFLPELSEVVADSKERKKWYLRRRTDSQLQ